MLGQMVLAMFTIQPVGDEVHTTVKTGDKVWRKKYGSISNATAEAIELRMMEEQTRPFVEGFLGQRTWPPSSHESTRSVDAVLFHPVRPVEVDLDELRTRGFLVDS
jgi:hypothetical protein